MLSIEFFGDKALEQKLQENPSVIRRALIAKVMSLTLKLEAHVKQDKLSGQVLHAKTGALRRAIASRFDLTDTTITGTVYVSGDVKYAHIHEYGGRTMPHDIVPVKAKALAFMMNGKQVFAKMVHHPGSVMPERSYLRSSLADMRNEIVSGIEETLTEATR